MSFRTDPLFRKIYGAHYAMIRRCCDPRTCNYDRYGGRGIQVCEAWHDFNAFYQWSIANGCSLELSIDRIDNDGDYEPSNCRWADAKTQQRNRSVTKRYTYNGETLSLPEWAEKVGMDVELLWARVYRQQWDLQAALTSAPLSRQQCGMRPKKRSLPSERIKAMALESPLSKEPV